MSTGGRSAGSPAGDGTCAGGEAAGGSVPWWAFWRRRPRSGAAASTPASDDGSVATGRPATRTENPDEQVREPRSAVAFSGASPDAALYALPEPPQSAARDRAIEIDAAALLESSSRVTELVAAVLAGDAAAVRGALLPRDGTAGDGPSRDDASSDLASGDAPSRHGASRATTAAAVSATAALAARLPVLSGVTGPAAFEGDGEDPRDLLLAYASLLTTRSEPHRLRLVPEVPREHLVQVAQAAAAAAHRTIEEHDGSPPTDRHATSRDLVAACSTDLPARTQLVAACLLLAQTGRDGGGGPAALRDELADLID